MNRQFSGDVNFLDGLDYTELKKFTRFSAGTVVTEEIGANATETFTASESDNLVDTLDIYPDTANLPKVARLIAAKINIASGSTDSAVSVFQSPNYNEIDQAISVSKLTESDTPETYVLGSGLGTPFVNKEGENQVYFQVEENSGNATVYEIELYWVNIPN